MCASSVCVQVGTGGKGNYCCDPVMAFPYAEQVQHDIGRVLLEIFDH